VGVEDPEELWQRFERALAAVSGDR
jgi:cystathionine beta-lyase/cystathionine gamma-synthase